MIWASAKVNRQKDFWMPFSKTKIKPKLLLEEIHFEKPRWKKKFMFINIGTGWSKGRGYDCPQYLESGGRNMVLSPNVWRTINKMVPKYHGLCRNFVKKWIAFRSLNPWTP